jgi:hypothetical protein
VFQHQGHCRLDVQGDRGASAAAAGTWIRKLKITPCCSDWHRVTFVAQEAPVPPRLSGQPSRRALAWIAVLVVLLGAGVVVGVVRFRTAHNDQGPTYSNADVGALAALELPGLQRVRSTWGCLSDHQNACFTTSLSPVRAARAVATALGIRQYQTVFSDGVATIRPHYTVCGTIGSAPMMALVDARPVNAVKQGNNWVVPDGQTPQYSGSTVDVYLTGPGHCALP